MNSLINKLFLELPLYNPLKLEEEEVIQEIVTIFLSHGSSEKLFDCYCVDCEKESTFKFFIKEFDNNGSVKSLNKYVIPERIVFRCQRNSNHYYSYLFKICNNEITKVGQSPSLASIESHSIQKYRKILSNDYRDFSKAMGLFSHGIGSGSFVYLRRIFENLIEEKKHEAIEHHSLDEEVFSNSRMDEKIKMLKDLLPNILVENRKLYSILSKGIHELSEEECLSLFPNLKLAIELILDEKIYILEQQKKIKTVQNFVSSTVEKY